MLGRALRLFHTVRYLKPIQITGRLAARLRRVTPDLRPAPPVRAVTEVWREMLWRPAGRVAPDRFRHLNVERRVATSADWNAPDADRLWLYTLHYLHDLHSVPRPRKPHDLHNLHPDFEEGAALIADWMAANPPMTGAGWEPYCLALRIVNWVRCAWSGGVLTEAAVQSLAIQARALADQIEWHLLGNHLFSDAKALVFAGAFFEGPEADRWLAEGAAILRAELPEQVLPDGGHFERSTMYHHIILGDVLDLLRLDRIAPGCLPADVVALLSDAAPRMLAWAEAMGHPDGDIAFFNDAAFGIAPPLWILEADAAALGVPASAPPGRLTRLADSGYVRAEVGPAVLLADVGEVGPDYLPGHAHADTLSCELSLHGQRLIVNGGTSTYVGPERLRERGTAAHSTVVIDGADSSEVWSSFRVARRARVHDLRLEETDRGVTLEALHNGYRRLPGRVDHHRRWGLSETGLEVTDTITGAIKSAEALWRLHPDVSAIPDGTGFRLEREGAAVAEVAFEGGSADIVAGVWAPEFGLTLPNQALCVRFDGPRLVSRFRWRPS